MTGCGWPETHCTHCDHAQHIHPCDESGCRNVVDDRDPTTGTTNHHTDDWGDIPLVRCSHHDTPAA